LRSLRLNLLIYNRYAKNIPAFVLATAHFGLFAITALLRDNYIMWKLSEPGPELYYRLGKMPFLAQKATRLRQLDRRRIGVDFNHMQYSLRKKCLKMGGLGKPSKIKTFKNVQKRLKTFENVRKLLKNGVKLLKIFENF
jgi:hypothetical protein